MLIIFIEIGQFENECAIEDVQPKKFEPTLGTLFDSYEEMFEFYKAYDRQ